MKIATVFEAATAAKEHLTRIWGGEVVESTINQQGDIYVIWAKFADGFSHCAYVNVHTGRVVDDIWF